MSNQLALARYVQAATQHGEGIEQRDSEKANAAHDALINALNELMAEPEGEHAALLSVLGHENPRVQCWAATHLLKHEPDKALPVLRRLSALPGLIGFGAEMVIKEWNKGKLP
ncbi:MAG: DUF2019 domain-containing protein [Nitrospira sp.]|nr:DUF2019 domain-containing protein [Nitrospira sp.]MBS0167424.1 DUF2019 domain-containing protein [Nitrospira sp.]